MPLVTSKFCKYVYSQAKLQSHQRTSKFCLEIQRKFFKCKICGTVPKDGAYHYLHQENCMLKLECARMRNDILN